MGRSALVALSLANLWYLRVWTELISYARADTYLMVHPPQPVDYVAVMINVLVTAAVFFGLHQFAVRRLSKRGLRIATQVFVASLIIPLNSLREVLARILPDYLKSPLFDLIGVRGVMAVAAGLGTIALLVIFRFPRQAAKLAIGILLLISPFCAITFGQGIWRATHYDDTAYRSKPALPLLANTGSHPRILWFICDEWDFRLTFLERNPTLSLPEIDRLRQTSLYAANAYPPAGGTPESIPSYYTGRRISPVYYTGPRQLEGRINGTNENIVWSKMPNIFEQVHDLGINTALIEWFHPSCRVLDGLSACNWWPLARQYNSMGDSLLEIMPNQTRSLVETSLFSPFGQAITAKQHRRVYEEMLSETKTLVKDSRYGFSVIHLPIPHNPFIYDRRTGTFTLSNSPIKGYVDHLALLDRTIGEIRQTMEAAGVWDSALVLFTSDHHFRGSRSLDGKNDDRIPYLLKFPSQKQPSTYEPEFNSVLTGRMLLAVLSGEIRDEAGAAAWLNAHRGEATVH